MDIYCRVGNGLAHFNYDGEDHVEGIKLARESIEAAWEAQFHANHGIVDHSRGICSPFGRPLALIKGGKQ
jgi:hypothetical protein